MLSHKQSRSLAILPVVGLFYVLQLLASLFIMQWPVAWLATALEFHSNLGGITILLLMIACGGLAIAGTTLLAVRTFKGQLSLARFCLVTVCSFLTFSVLSYVLLFIGNSIFSMGWSLL